MKGSSISSGMSVLDASILILVALLPPPEVLGHGHMISPRSRNFVAYEDGKWWDSTDASPKKEDCPHCLNRGGTLSACGLVGDRDYSFPRTVNGRPLPWKTQGVYTQGEEIDIEVVLSAHHKGHFEYNVCPVSAGATPDQSCFDAHPLEFVKDNLYGAPKDPNHKNRAYVPDASFPDLKHQIAGGVRGSFYSHRFQLPANLDGETVLLQWHYRTANSCVYRGYDDYGALWPRGVSYGRRDGTICPANPDGDGVPEQFWNCAEIRIDAAGDGDGGEITTEAPSTAAAATTAMTTGAPAITTEAPPTGTTTTSTSTSTTIDATITTTGGPTEDLTPAWVAGSVYWGGDTVVYGGVKYEAKWWTNGSSPPDPAGQPYGPWEKCADEDAVRGLLRGRR